MRRLLSSRIRRTGTICAARLRSSGIIGSGATGWSRSAEMRVIGGEFRSRILKSLHGHDIRPTPDRLRETLFDILTPRIEGVVFADVYAGTGAVGIGALSR